MRLALNLVEWLYLHKESSAPSLCSIIPILLRVFKLKALVRCRGQKYFCGSRKKIVSNDSVQRQR